MRRLRHPPGSRPVMRASSLPAVTRIGRAASRHSITSSARADRLRNGQAASTTRVAAACAPGGAHVSPLLPSGLRDECRRVPNGREPLPSEQMPLCRSLPAKKLSQHAPGGAPSAGAGVDASAAGTRAPPPNPRFVPPAGHDSAALHASRPLGAAFGQP